ncbi:MAG: ACT domain-containing protein [Methanomicrobiaceae archaeon]|nr:ACT domain-containing protein [Methanomicrobiaceae archaeon]
MKIAALGPEGTISHEVAHKIAGSNDIILLPSIARIFGFVMAGEGVGLVPLENSESGGIGATLNGLREHPVFITGQITVPVAHHFAVADPGDTISTLYVHPETHEQCAVFIESLGIPVVHTASNAESARSAHLGVHTGAITTRTAAEHWSLSLIRTDVQNTANNRTRFIRISREPCPVPESGTCSILVDPADDRVGLLHAILGVFRDRGINLSRIESRPSTRRMGEYIFFLDADLHPQWQEALSALAPMARVRALGCYGTLGEAP